MNNRPKLLGSLDPDNWTEFRRQAHRMLDDMFGYMENIRDYPVWQVIPDEVRERFRAALPIQPTSLEEVHQEFMTSILPFASRNGHPGFLGWVQGGGTPVGMLAEMLAAGLNANTGGRDQIPLEVEKQVVEWMRILFNFPPTASGLFVTGTSMANTLAVLIARDWRLGSEVRRRGNGPSLTLTAYASMAAHGSIGRALDFAGLGSEHLRLIAVDGRQQMDVTALGQAIVADRERGFIPFLVTGTAGTVDTGAIDDLAAIAQLCAESQLWFHVDGAYGALAMLAPELAPRLKGIEQADSLAFDFHKWAQVPYDAGFILVRDGARQRAAFSSSCSYLVRDERGLSAGSPWPCDLGPDLSRGFRALKTWATLKVYGTNAIGAVIQRSCELARYLESCILASTELELMAPVELNIVCFRYRFAGLSDDGNREIVTRLQEAGEVAPSTATIRGCLWIRAAIVNHRTSPAEVDTLVAATVAAGQALSAARTHAEGEKWQPWVERHAAIQLLDAKLSEQGKLPKEEEIALRVRRASLLVEMGRNLEARSDHLRVIELDPTQRENLFALGRLLASMGHHKAAQMVYAEAVKYYPDDPALLVNLGSVLLEMDNAGAARLHYKAALGMDPELPQAHAGMYYALTRLGERELAKWHQEKGFRQKTVFPSLFRGDAEPVAVLLLVSSTGGNTPLEKLLDGQVFQTYVVVADFHDREIPLPVHQLVVNGIGDADVASTALVAAQSLLELTSAPVVNFPAAVLASRRCESARRLGKLPGIKAPVTVTFSHSVLGGEKGATALAAAGFTFPLLLRTPGFHMGQHFVRVNSATMLGAAVASLPGAGDPAATVLAIEYLDARGADGCTRKYRVMIVDGQLYPLHLAISEDWKIHYFSADMRDRAEHRREEANFLADMANVLGAKAMAALEALAGVLDLDYGGIDFGLNEAGEILLFEANATMVVEQPDGDPRWDYRREAVGRIHAAVRDLLLGRAGAISILRPAAVNGPAAGW
jgi:glutamate/tyrosine decarboxylase-like PLP-dependent enzyme